MLLEGSFLLKLSESCMDVLVTPNATHRRPTQSAEQRTYRYQWAKEQFFQFSKLEAVLTDESRFSGMNCIGHIWDKISKKVNSVQQPP